MSRICAICGKTSMGGFNPQSVGMNRVRAHRRYEPNLQPMRLAKGGTTKPRPRLHSLPADSPEDRLTALIVRARLRCAALSSQMVIGPSLTSSTSISAPKTPRATRTPRASTAFANRS